MIIAPSRTGREHQRYDPDPKQGTCRLLAGVVPVDVQNGKVLLITSSRKRKAAARLKDDAMEQEVGENATSTRSSQVASTSNDGEVIKKSGEGHDDENIWILPKGGWEEDESLEQCARREALEEAGVTGTHLVPLLDWSNESSVTQEDRDGSRNDTMTCPSSGGINYITRKGKHCRVFGFILKVDKMEEDWAESDTRTRLWS